MAQDKVKMITLCCGNGKAKDIIFSTIINTNKCLCLKCQKESILISKEDYKKIKEIINNES